MLQSYYALNQIIAGAHQSYAISKDTVYLWGKKIISNSREDTKAKVNPSSEEDKIVQLSIKVQDLATGPKHTFAWNDKQVYCWGSNQNYELGLQEQKDYDCQKVELFE